MKYNSIFSIISFFMAGLFFSQLQSPPAIEWSKNYGGTYPETHADINLTSDGGYIIAGGSKSSNGDTTVNYGLFDFWIVKINSVGNIQWQKSLGGSNNEIAYSVQQTSDGGYIVAGETNSSNGNITQSYGERDMWVVKLDLNGNLVWQKTFGGSGDDVARYIRQTPDGGYIVIGSTSSFDGVVASGNRGLGDVWVLKLDNAGNLQWEKTYGGGNIDRGNSIELTSDGGYIMACNSKSNDNQVTGNHGNYDYWIVKINSSGNIQWQKSLGGSNSDEAYSAKQTTDGGYIVLGASISNNGDVTGNHGNYDYWLVKLNSSGNIQWQKSHGGTLYDHGRSVSQTTDGGYILSGYAMPIAMEGVTAIGSNDYLVIKTDSTGDAQWQRTFGHLTDDYSNAILQTPDEGYIISGYSDAVTGTTSNYDYWVIKLAGNQLSTNEVAVKRNITIFPNPVKNFLNINNLPLESTVTINDAAGRKVYSKKYSEKNITINTSELINGNYILQIENERRIIFSEKIIVSK